MKTSHSPLRGRSRGRVKQEELIDGLTPKQHTFVEVYLQTDSGTYAAKVAYNARNTNTAAVIASENFRKPAVRVAIDNGLMYRLAEVQFARIDRMAELKQEVELGLIQGRPNAGIEALTELWELHEAFQRDRELMESTWGGGRGTPSHPHHS